MPDHRPRRGLSLRRAPPGDEVTRAAELSGDEGKAILWFKYQPIVGFGRTAEALVEDGRGDAVLWALDGMEQGVYA